MNERIRELAIEARELADIEYAKRQTGYDLESILMQKFAELIVRECSKVITNSGYWHHMTKGWSQATPPEIAKMVREHFGIEE